MIAMEYNGYFSASTKKERAAIHKNLAGLISHQGSKLEPISYGAVKHFANAANRNEIYRVTGMETGFKKFMDRVPGKVIYFGSWMAGSCGGNRIRKYALADLDNGDQFIVYQEIAMFSMRLSVVNTRTLERVAFRTAEEAAGYLLIMQSDLEALPLLIHVKGEKLRQLVKDRLNNIN
jgi:hypothetical protein